MSCVNHPQREAVAKCHECGKDICAECLINIEDKTYCQEHALRQLQTEKNPPMYTTESSPPLPTHYSMTTVYPYKNKITATLFCLFFGWMGAHRYYMGKTGSAILYTCTAGLCGIGWIIDLVLLIAGNPRDGRGQPLV